MKDISIYFQANEKLEDVQNETIAQKIQMHTEGDFPDLKEKSIALIFCPEYRNAQIDFPTKLKKDVFKDFLQLHAGDSWDFDIYDLGTILPGNEIKDTYFALNQVVTELIKNKILPIIVGGSQDLTFAIYQAYQNLEQLLNLTFVDYAFDLGDPEANVCENGYISQLLMQRPCYLFNVSTIGVQAPYVKKSEFEMFEKLYFDTCRLGEYNADFKKSEPLLRNSDVLSVDLDAIRNSDYKSIRSNPNGFFAHDMCQIAKYAGMSDKLSVFSLFNVNLENRNFKVIAEMLWYFIDGFANRKGDFPIGLKKDYTKFIVHLDDQENELIFYKSPKSNRWWMEVPYPANGNSKFERHHIVPCNFEDYQDAMKNELPNLWWKTYQKLV